MLFGERKRRDVAKRDNDARIDLTTLPFLTTRRVCIIADCVPSTVRRSPMVPAGRRGRTYVYRTSDVLSWLAGGLETDESAEAMKPEVARAPANVRGALDRLKTVTRGLR